MPGNTDERQKQEINQWAEKCQSAGVRLLTPKGVRKYYSLQKNGVRVRLGKSWELAKIGIDDGLKWFAENNMPDDQG